MFLCFLQVRLFNERQSHFALTSSLSILKSGISSYAGISLASFDHQRNPKRSFCAQSFGNQTSKSTVQRGLLMFSEFGKLHVKKIISFTPAGECVQSVQSLERRLEDLHSLSLNFCLIKFVRTIERAFVQVSRSFANGFLNTCVWISEHAFLDT